ncbi:MAG: hypothetical protein ACO1Q7_17235 [Gemmatimonas sp.]
MRHTTTSLTSAALLIATCVFAACSDSSTEPQPQTSVLTGLSAGTRNDTVTTPAPNTSGSGNFRGTVMGPSVTGPGTDTLATSPRIANVTVTIYPRLADVNGEITLGAAAGSTTSNAQGQWTLPTLPAGEYVVTFVPPENSNYRGSYAFGPLRSNSNQYAWWVVLNKK